MKLKALILSFLFLLTGSGLKVEVATCCDVLSGISVHFKDNGFQQAKDCCACIKASKKSTCCHTQSYSTVINSVLGLQKAQTIAHKDFSKKFAIAHFSHVSLNTSINSIPVSYCDLNPPMPSVPILIQKRVLQI
jgi:hypothetical protein